MPKTQLNIAQHLATAAATQPWKRAVVVAVGRDSRGGAAYSHVTFHQLQVLCDRFAAGLAAAGVKKGMRALIMVRPGLEFAPLVFALFKMGAIPVMIDPGMGWRSLARAVRQAGPEAFIGIPQAHLLRFLAPLSFRGIRIPIVLGRIGICGAPSLQRLARQAGVAPLPMAGTAPDDPAAILFTTGSTGPAKGVVYTHRIFDAQIRLLRETFGITPADIDLPCFPLFGLFSLAMGVTTVIPTMDFTRPAAVLPMNIIEPILGQGVTYSFGSPALWRTVGAYCAKHGVRLPSLRKILMAGAPVAPELHRCLLEKVLTAGAETWTPYGATEALPVASFNGRAVLAETADKSRQGAGTCVGWPVPGVTVRVIRISDAQLTTWRDAACLPQGQIGEFVVQGDVVTPEYCGLPEATRLAKIGDGDRIWHRMGDVGYVDAQGRLWFCGRKSHRVRTPQGTLFTVPCEAIFNQHEHVYRAALVGVGDAGQDAQTPVIVIEPQPGHMPTSAAKRAKFAGELLELGQRHPHTAGIQRVLFRRGFPVDFRHNAKIRREELAAWAARRISAHSGMP